MQTPPATAPSVRALLESAHTPFTIIHRPPGSAVFRQGDEGDTVMHIESGRVWLAVTKASGKEAICGLLEPGSFLGEEVLAGQALRPHTATAMTPAELLVVGKADMGRLLQTQPALSTQFIEHAIERTIRLQSDLVDQLLFSAEQRLAHTLLLLAGCDERQPSSGTLPHVSQEIIAEMVGTTRSRINLFLGRFKKAGFIDDHGHELTVHPSLLRVLNRDPRAR